ncbi:MAG TPA: tryptophan synthase subunit alpha [Puia sp.]|jgi:tryptophan synthase alpha chain|nr:tryptophan synthase subunit alpha [Puia sp.]
MSRLKELFERKRSNVLSVYCMAGFPRLDSTIEVIKALQDNGADMIELGMPYSDPLADGPVIQASGSKALENGMSISRLFGQLMEMRASIRIPVLLMGYLNPILQYGFEKFCEAGAAAGVDGLILPDLPIYEFEAEYGPVIKKHGLDFVFLVTPETSGERIRKVDALSSGFVYAVSSSSTTGGTKDLAEQEAYFLRLEGMRLKNPVLVGFGVRDKASFETACRHTQGAIIGTAYIRAIDGAKDIGKATQEFLGSIL